MPYIYHPRWLCVADIMEPQGNTWLIKWIAPRIPKKHVKSSFNQNLENKICRTYFQVYSILILGDFMLLDSIICHYSDVIMSALTSPIIDASIVSSTVCSGADQRKHQSSAVAGGFPSQRASNLENVSIWWRHHDSINNGCSFNLTLKWKYWKLVIPTTRALPMWRNYINCEYQFRFPTTFSRNWLEDVSCVTN